MSGKDGNHLLTYQHVSSEFQLTGNGRVFVKLVNGFRTYLTYGYSTLPYRGIQPVWVSSMAINNGSLHLSCNKRFCDNSKKH